MICQSCSSNVPIDAKFCHKCGNPVSLANVRAVFCPQCGMLNDAGSLACQGCAYHLTGLSNPGPSLTKCPNCNANVTIDAYFCNGSGRRLRQDPSHPPYHAGATLPRPTLQATNPDALQLDPHS